jgi:hypothetical protein
VPTRITFIYDNPNDPAAFETDHPDLLAMAKAIPGFQCVKVSRGVPRSIAALLRRRTTVTAPRREQ